LVLYIYPESSWWGKYWLVLKGGIYTL
jgi:hypothetical protein